MKRLLDIQADSALVEEAQRLLASADPVPDSPERMWRVRRRLDHPAPGALAFVRSLPAFSVAGVLLLFGGSVFAAVRLVSSVVANLGAHADPTASQLPAASAVPLPPPPPRLPPLAANAPGASLATAEPQLEAVEPPNRVASAPSSVRQLSSHGSMRARARHLRRASKLLAQRQRAHRASAAAAATPAPASVAGAVVAVAEPAPAPASPDWALHSVDQKTERVVSVEDTDLSRKVAVAATTPRTPEADSGSELVHRALRALRRDKDPELAARLLAKHRARDPEGPLAEETLALQIEAASQLDPGRARNFAREYLSRFPAGRYRSAAERAAQDRSP